MRTELLRIRGREVLVSVPNTRNFGHMGLETLFSLWEARTRGVPLCFGVPREAMHPLLQLQPDDQEVVRLSPLEWLILRERLRLRRWMSILRTWLYTAALAVRAEARAAVSAWLVSPMLTPALRRRLKHRQAQLKAPSLEEQATWRGESLYYYRRRTLRERLPVRLPAALQAEAGRQAEDMGIGPDARIVTAHAREAGYWGGREMQDAKPGLQRSDATRNARIETYFQAFDYLVAQGYTVVRIGDPSMTPVRHPGVIDLATSPARTPLLETSCLLRSHFLLGCDSGPLGVIYLTNTPFLATNCTEPISTYPIRQDGLCLLKHVTDRRTGRRLSPRDLLSHDYLSNFRNPDVFLYEDNSPAEVLAGVQEMLRRLAGDTNETAGQRQFREDAAAAAGRLASAIPYVRKWGADGGFLGDGRLCEVMLKGATPP